MSATTDSIKRQIEEAEVSLRELGSLSGLNYQKICDWKKGWTELKGSELAALKNALIAAIRMRVEKFNKMLTQIGADGGDGGAPIADGHIRT